MTDEEIVVIARDDRVAELEDEVDALRSRLASRDAGRDQRIAAAFCLALALAIASASPPLLLLAAAVSAGVGVVLWAGRR